MCTCCNREELCDPVRRGGKPIERWIHARRRLTVLGAVSTTRHTLLQLNQPILRQQELSIFSFPLINSSQYCQSVLPSTFSTSQYCQLVLIKTSTPPAPRASYQIPGTQAGRTPACTAELLSVSQDVYTTSYFCRLKDESTTNYYRLLDIPATSSSRMQGLRQVAHLRVLPSS